MSNFDTALSVKANKQHRCCECHGGINKGEVYERAFVVYEGDVSSYKTCKKCCDSRDWLLNDTDWADDIDGEGHSFFFTNLRDHLIEQARGGDRKFSFRAYRLVVEMGKRRKIYAEAYNAETIKIRDRFIQVVGQ
ncbi:TPA: hypothetical protein ACQ8UR_003899 [Escherichia coli]